MTYTSKSTYVDVETGEIIRRENVITLRKYLIIKVDKKITYDNQKFKTRGHIEYTIKCRRNPQRDLFEGTKAL